ncbi:MAG: hypothetical protein ACI9HJ_002136, partial [Ulvibacter sp.]
LYRVNTQTRSGFLAESLLDGKKISVSARHNVSLLSEIAIYTLTEELPLRAVFAKISEKEDGGEAISHKSSKDELEEYFFGVLPDYDEDRVYSSDIKKVVQWYNLLIKSGMSDFSETTEEDDAGDDKVAKAIEASKVTGDKSVASNSSSSKGSSSKKGGAGKNTAARKT